MLLRFLSRIIKNPYGFIAALVIGAVFSMSASVWATTIGANVTVTGTFTSNGNSTIGDATGDIHAFTGNVGLGTASPKQLLHVEGSGVFLTDLFINGNDINLGTGSATTTISGGFGIGVGTTTPGAAFAIATSTAGVNTAFLIANLGTGYTAWFQDTADDTTPFVIDAAGNVGIGTSTPTAALAIATTTSQVVTAFLVSNAGAGPTAYFEDVANDGSPTVIDTAGNLGVGTTTPGTLFSVDKTANFSSASSTFYSDITVPTFAATSTTATSTITNGLLISKSAGSVGIGTSTPVKTLSVLGSILAGGGAAQGTTTITVDTNVSGKGSCLQMRAASTSDMYRIYVGNTGTAQASMALMVERGACDAQN